MRPVPCPNPLPACIEVRRLDFDLNAGVSLKCQALTPVERAQADRFTRTADRVRFTAMLAANLYLKLLLDVAGSNASLFNVSHSGARTLIALGDARRMSEVDAETIASLAFIDSEHCVEKDAGDRLQALPSTAAGLARRRCSRSSASIPTRTGSSPSSAPCPNGGISNPWYSMRLRAMPARSRRVKDST